MAGASTNWAEIIGNNVLSLAFVLMVLLFISFTLSYAANRMEHAFRRQEHLLALLFAFYKELMILGLISFLLFIAEIFDLLQFLGKLNEIGLDTDSNMISLLHVVHICLFLTMIGYILLVIFLYFLTNQNRAYWTRTEKISVEELELKKEQITEKLKDKRMLAHPFLMWSYYNVNEQLTYHRLRKTFIKHENLKPEFSFYYYMKKCARKVLILVIEIHWTVWIVLLCFVVGNFVRVKVCPDCSGGGILVFVLIGWGLCLISAIVFIKCRFIAHRLGNIQNTTSTVVTEHTEDTEEGSDFDSDDDTHHHYASGHYEARRCGCLRITNSKYQTLFWFNSPNFLLHVIQLILLSQALYATFYTIVFAKQGYNDWGPGSIPAVVIPFFLNMCFFIPTVLPTYTLVRYVDSTSVPEVIATFKMESDRTKLLCKRKFRDAKKSD